MCSHAIARLNAVSCCKFLQWMLLLIYFYCRASPILEGRSFLSRRVLVKETQFPILCFKESPWLRFFTTEVSLNGSWESSQERRFGWDQPRSQNLFSHLFLSILASRQSVLLEHSKSADKIVRGKPVTPPPPLSSLAENSSSWTAPGFALVELSATSKAPSKTRSSRKELRISINLTKNFQFSLSSKARQPLW